VEEKDEEKKNADAKAAGVIAWCSLLSHAREWKPPEPG